MPALSLLGVVLFAVQFALGYYAYRTVSAARRDGAPLAAGFVVLAGFFVLFRHGVVWCLALDVVVLLVLGGVRGTGRRSEAR